MSQLDCSAPRIGWISSPPDKDDLGLLSHFQDLHRFSWTLSRFAFGNDESAVRAVHAAAPSCDGFFISGLSLAEFESLFNLRAMQLLRREARFDLPSVVLVRPGSEPTAFHRLGDRVRSGWPFRSVLFIADAPTADLLRREGLAAIGPDEARNSGLPVLLASNEGRLPDMLTAQRVAVQIQPPWLYGGSHTVFSNQIDALLDRGWFILRIIVDPEAGPGPTMRRRMVLTIAEANVDATPHLDTVACAAGAPESIDEPAADEDYRRSLRNRMQTFVADTMAERLAARADIAVVNYVVHLGFALKACPAAKLVLETHDDITCMNLTRSRVIEGHRSFPDLASLKRHLALERLAWRAADVCVALSLSDLRKIRRHAPSHAFVLPRPYARRALEAGGTARWDILIVMNPHHFNVPALHEFLREVIVGDPRLAKLSIAVAGRVNEVLEEAWKDRLPNVEWLGYVKDIDALRDQSRISVCPDLNGTGIAIKTLTAIVAEHPLVATRTALRGLPAEILALIPPADGVAELQSQLVNLLHDETLLEARRRDVSRAAALLWPATSHQAALTAALQSGDDKSQLRASLLALLDDVAAVPDSASPDRIIRFGSSGNDRPYLVSNWLHDEPGGRWSDGASAVVRIPSAWLSSRCRLVISFMQTPGNEEIELRRDGLSLKGRSPLPGTMWFDIDPTDRIDGDSVEFEIACRTAFCPKDAGISKDERILGVHIRSIEIVTGFRRQLIAPWVIGLSELMRRAVNRIARARAARQEALMQGRLD